MDTKALLLTIQDRYQSALSAILSDLTDAQMQTKASAIDGRTIVEVAIHTYSNGLALGLLSQEGSDLWSSGRADGAVAARGAGTAGPAGADAPACGAGGRAARSGTDAEPRRTILADAPAAGMVELLSLHLAHLYWLLVASIREKGLEPQIR
jgi:hypothetical protein